MHPRNALPGCMGALHLRDDLVQGQRRRIDAPRAGFGEVQDLARHQGAGVEHQVGALDQALAAQGQQVGRARSGTDEVHSHADRPARAPGAALPPAS